MVSAAAATAYGVGASIVLFGFLFAAIVVWKNRRDALARYSPARLDEEAPNTETMGGTHDNHAKEEKKLTPPPDYATATATKNKNSLKREEVPLIIPAPTRDQFGTLTPHYITSNPDFSDEEDGGSYNLSLNTRLMSKVRSVSNVSLYASSNYGTPSEEFDFTFPAEKVEDETKRAFSGIRKQVEASESRLSHDAAKSRVNLPKPPKKRMSTPAALPSSSYYSFEIPLDNSDVTEDQTVAELFKNAAEGLSSPSPVCQISRKKPATAAEKPTTVDSFEQEGTYSTHYLALTPTQEHEEEVAVHTGPITEMH